MRTELESTKIDFHISDWDSLNNIDECHHDIEYTNILNSHDFGNLVIPIPLKGRYTKGRRWSKLEFEACYNAWKNGYSLTLIAASLNRNPQDMIYKLLDRCKEDGVKFTQKGRSESSKNWSPEVKTCAESLFENGLPAWKIAAIFQVEFEHVEKELFVKRKGYGHEKKNPFTINTDHKQFVNESIVGNLSVPGNRILEAFAGEGRFTKIFQDSDFVDEIVCIESDPDTYKTLESNVGSYKTKLYQSDNLELLGKNSLGKFDVVDIDPFVTCHKQLELVWTHLKDNSFLFVTFGGEYRRSFITTNRQSIFNRYGFNDTKSSNSDYLEVIPKYFLGFVAAKAAENGFTFSVLRAVRYANNCRYWLEVKRDENTSKWLDNNVVNNESGFIFKNLEIPRFREVRKEIDDAKKLGFSR